mgnify:CR=1 FL=1
MLYMKILKSVIKTEQQHQLFLTIVFIIYILFDVQLPHVLANMIDSLTGNIVVSLLALSLFMYTTPMLGILGFVVAYIMIARSSSKKGAPLNNNYIPSEKSKMKNLIKYNDASEFSKYNEYPDTLEQEMVAKMAPLVRPAENDTSSYKPVLDNDNHAAPIDYEGVV